MSDETIEWIPLTQGKPIPDKTYWITDGEYICLADTYSGGLSINDWSQVESYGIVPDLSLDGVEDFQLMKRVTHYAEFEPMSVPELPNKIGDIVNEWISVKDRLPPEELLDVFIYMDDERYIAHLEGYEFHHGSFTDGSIHVNSGRITHWQYIAYPKPPIQLNINLDEDVADIREERICKNCEHFAFFTKSKQDKNKGDCKKISIANGMELVYDEGGCTVRNDFGCNQWQKKTNKPFCYFQSLIDYETGNGVTYQLKPCYETINDLPDKWRIGTKNNVPVYADHTLGDMLDD